MRYIGASTSSIDSVEKWDRFRYRFNAGVQMTFWRTFVGDGAPNAYLDAPTQSARDWFGRMNDELSLVCAHPIFYELIEAMPKGAVTDEQRRAHLRWWVTTFGDRVDVVDVVNEPYHNPLKDWRWYFAELRRIHPRILRRFNEYEILDGKAYKQIADFVRPHLDVIDVIGIQAHYLSPIRNGRLPSIDTVRRALDHMAALGKPIHITEVSVPYARNGWTETLQAKWVEQLMNVFRAHPAVDAVFWWDLSDANAWNPTSGLWRADGSTKPAWEVFRE